MSDPYFSYSPSQQRIYRAVHGAVRNTGHGHPNWKFRDDMARSIAKRATGTLTAQWREVLAAGTPSDKAVGAVTTPRPPCVGKRRCSRRRHKATGSVARKGITSAPRRSPLRILHNQFGALVKQAKHDGRMERAEALKDALRLLAAVAEAA